MKESEPDQRAAALEGLLDAEALANLMRRRWRGNGPRARRCMSLRVQQPFASIAERTASFSPRTLANFGPVKHCFNEAEARTSDARWWGATATG